ncbi:MAG: lysophospholipid acyltransferase family protein [Rhodospirillales bacterium]|nr:lysophospholipid acyltransferase family protein [Rhodospirillales bacterium]
MATPQFIKNISRNDLVRGLSCVLASLLIRLVWLTGKWHTTRAPGVQDLWQTERPFIVCFWHGRLMMLPYSWTRSHNLHMLISDHPDGKLIAGTVAKLGIHTVAGSTRRGGAGALRGLVRILKNGETVGITPDGPAGPRMRASGGAVALARLSGAPLVPLAYATSKRRIMSSWDKFHLAWPFSRGVFIWGDPLEVPKDADTETLERLRLELEVRLNIITGEADRLCGHTPVEPAPPADEAAS